MYIYIYYYTIISIGYPTVDYVHWIGLREMLQETPMILMVKTHGFSVMFP